MYRLTWRPPLAGLVAFSYLQFSQIRGRQPYSIVRKIPYLITARSAKTEIAESEYCSRFPHVNRSTADETTFISVGQRNGRQNVVQL